MASAVALALGAVIAALASKAIPPVALLLAAGSAVVARAVIHEARRGARGVRPRVSARGVAALGLGLGVVALRVLLAPSAPPGEPPTGDGPWLATVVSVGPEHGATRPAVLVLEEPAGVIVAATLPWYPVVGADDRVSVKGRIEPPPAGDYATYLARIGAVGSLRADSIDVLAPPDGIGRTLEELRRGASAALARAVPEPEAGLASGILIGLRDRVDRQLAADFTTAGASHVVAISGWNIAIVATSVGAIAGSLGRRRRTILTSLAIVGYVCFVGPSPSVVRAAAMAGLALLARELGRPSRATAALGWAVAGLLLLDPGYIDDAGFRLSVLATAGLMAWGTGLSRRIAGPSPGRVRAWLAESLGVSLAAHAATLPVILLDFGRLSLVSPVVNLAVVPLVAPAMAAGTVALLAGWIAGWGLPSAIATIGGLPAWVLLTAIVGSVRVGASVPFASVTLGPPWDVVAAVGSAVLVALIALRGPAIAKAVTAWRHPRSRPSAAAKRPSAAAKRPSAAAKQTPKASGASRRRRAPRLAVAALAASSLGLAIAVANRPSGVVTVTVLDVGQGDGILVESGTGLRLLVDGGPDPRGLVRTLDERLPPWDRRIDIVVLTHPHEDHVAGLGLLLARYRVGRVYEPGMIGPGPGYKAWAAALGGGGGGPPHGVLATGDRFSLGPVAFRVLWPDPGRVPEHPADGGTAINNVSIVLLGTFGPHRFLLAGDVEQEVDPELLARGLPKVELLKVAHHGSKTASTEPFLEAVHPKVAVASAGLGNPYGHPAPATIERLRAITPRTYRTDLDGTVQVRFDGDVLRVTTTAPHRAAAAGSPTGAAATGLAAAAASPPAVLFACAITTAAAAQSTRNDPLPVVAEAPAADLRSVTRAVAAGHRSPWDRPRLPTDGVATGLSYHRSGDGPGPFHTDAIEPGRARGLRAARVPVGRRRVRTRGGGRCVPDGSEPVPRRCARPVASGIGSGRVRPPPERDHRARRDGLAVRRGHAGRCRWGDPADASGNGP
jgi:competence protein ComEC